MLTQTDSTLDLQATVTMLPREQRTDEAPEPVLAVETVDVWGLPLAIIDHTGALGLVDKMIAGGRPGLFITANLHYARLSAADPRLRGVNARAAFLTADGMPLVWYSRLMGRRLPARVAGADLVRLLCARAEQRGHRVFFLGGADGVARRAADRLLEAHPRLAVAGVAAPEFGELTAADHEALVRRIRSTRPDILLAALGQPKGELWLDRHREALGVPACVQVGASLDFLAGHVRRAPRWMQRTGTEWFYRAISDPRRLVPRYLRDGLFLCRSVAGDLLRRPLRRS